VTSLEASDAFTNRNKLANFDYVLLDYSTVPDAEAEPTEKDFKAYYEGHKNAFKSTQPMRSFEYVVFEAIPTATDSIAAREGIQQALEEFKVSDNDSLFAAIKSDTKYPLIYRKKGSLPPLLDSAVFSGTEGT